MKTDKKKIAAAMAAVFAYVKTSEEAAAFYMPEDSAEQIIQPIQSVQRPNIWGMTGRQIHMQANTMMQMRMFK